MSSPDHSSPDISDEEFKANKEVYYKQGNEVEKKYFDTIIKFFNIDLNDYKLKQSRYNVIDWTFTHKITGKIISIEVKSRNSKKEAYPTTIFGTNKFLKQVKGLYSGKIEKAVVVFVFEDEMNYFEIQKDSIKDVDFKDIVCNLRGRMEKANHCLIPIELLKLIQLINV
jgi:hypothetical protein